MDETLFLYIVTDRCPHLKSHCILDPETCDRASKVHKKFFSNFEVSVHLNFFVNFDTFKEKDNIL